VSLPVSAHGFTLSGPLRRPWRGWDALPASPAGDGPAVVERVDPADGSVGVFRDAAVLLRFSRPADPGSIHTGHLRVEDPKGPVPGCLRLSPDGRVVVWTAGRLLDAETLHFIIGSGLRDDRGMSMALHLSRFVPGRMTQQELTPEQI
jgi:hypothetical protein